MTHLSAASPADAAAATAAAALLAALPGLAFAFVLLLARVGAALMLVPVLGEAEVPSMVRAGFAVLVVVLLLPPLRPLLPDPPDSILRAAGAVAAEAITGLWLGWLARLIVFALSVAGQIVSLATGLSNVLQPDPALGTQSSALARVMAATAPVLLLAGGLHAWPLAALAGSYRVVPAGVLPLAAATTAELVDAVGASFGLALRLAAPFLVASLLWHVVLGLALRLAAQVQPMTLAAPVQVLGGLALLAMIPVGLLAVWSARAAELLAALPGLG